MDEFLREAELESFLFQGTISTTEQKDTAVQDESILQETTSNSPVVDEASYFEDCDPVNEALDSSQEKGGWVPVWHDPADDESIDPEAQDRRSVKRILLSSSTAENPKMSDYELQLRKEHQQVHSQTDWALLEPSKSEDPEVPSDEDCIMDDVLGNAAPLLTQTPMLRKGRIEVSSVADANMNDPHPSKLASIEYSPGGELFMTATKSGRVSLFHVDGHQNPLIDAITIKKFKIIQSGFLPQKEKILVIGSPQYQSIHLLDLEAKTTETLSVQDPTELFHSFKAASVHERAPADLIAFVSDSGSVPIYSLKSHQWITRINCNRAIDRVVFLGNHLYTCSVGGRVHVWDMRSFQCSADFIDQGTLNCTAIDVCPGQQYFATGSDSGVVNVYKAKDCLPEALSMQPTQLKTLFNLKTEIDTIAFHPNSEIMAMASIHMPAAMRLVHLPSCTVFSNWPNQRLSTSRVSCVAFSPNGDLMHVGSLTGRVSSYRLLHYVR